MKSHSSFWFFPDREEPEGRMTFPIWKMFICSLERIVSLMHSLTPWFERQSSSPRGYRPASSHSFLLRFGRDGLLLFCLGLLTCLASSPSVHAKDNRNDEKSTQGVIVLVDRTNAQDVTFSLLDRTGTSMTFHLTSKTRFAAHQSASQLVPNLLARVDGRPTASGDWTATLVQFQRNTASLILQGVVASVQSNQTIDLALTDGAVSVVHLSSSAIASVHTGMRLIVQAIFLSSMQLQAKQIHIQEQHAKQYQVRGILSHINTRTHRLSLLTSQGSAFSVRQAGTQKGNAHQTTALHIGENVTVSGTTDSQGNLNVQQVIVNTDHASQMEIIGTVTARDTTANTISVVDQDGNVTTLTTSAALLASLQVGTTYQFSVTLASDGTLTAIKRERTDGSDKGTSLEVEGVVQSYDASSKVVSLLGENDQIFSLQATDQTTITGENNSSAVLQQGQAVKVKAQVNADGTYTALMIEIQDTASQGDPMTFVGPFQSYDASSNQLTLTLESSTRTLTTTAQTRVEGATSLNTIPVGSLLKVTTQIQPDGSYLALTVEVKTHHDGNESGDHHGGKTRKSGGLS